MDIMLNRWLLYQTLSCRYWAGAGFTRREGPTDTGTSQDILSLLHAAPAVAREHILRWLPAPVPRGGCPALVGHEPYGASAPGSPMTGCFCPTLWQSMCG